MLVNFEDRNEKGVWNWNTVVGIKHVDDKKQHGLLSVFRITISDT